MCFFWPQLHTAKCIVVSPNHIGQYVVWLLNQCKNDECRSCGGWKHQLSLHPGTQQTVGVSRLYLCRWYTKLHYTLHDTSCRQGSSVTPPVTDWWIYKTELHRGHKLVFTVNMRWLEHSIRNSLKWSTKWLSEHWTYVVVIIVFVDILVSEGYFYGEKTKGK